MLSIINNIKISLAMLIRRGYMLDYKGLEALFAVIECQNFEKAAARLFITQSAISQRIKQLEAYFGKPLLIRQMPYRPTPMAEKLLGLLRRTKLLESHLLADIVKDNAQLSIAVNRDSLETWFLKALKRTGLLEQIHCEIITDDQEVTLDYFKKGLVAACVSTTAKPLPECQSQCLGHMDYALVASPEFVKKKLAKKSIEQLLAAPAIVFDNKDTLTHRYLEKYFNIKNQSFNYHTVPSVRGFKQFVLCGAGYGLLPIIDIKDELAQGNLESLFPQKHWPMTLYWHYWQIQAQSYQRFNQYIIDFAQKNLRAP
jgi:LysR family transcriptional regulator, chromosome initiation inhibitor